MPKNFEELENSSNKIKDLVNTAQIDIMDGIFTQNKSWPYTEEGSNRTNREFEKFKNKEKKLPFLNTLSYEADLMVKNPEEKLEEWLAFEFKRIIFHIESSEKEKLKNLINKVRKKNKQLKIGLALNIETPNEALDEFLKEIDFVQFMGIATIGVQGEKFDERVLEKIKNLRKKRAEVPISVDGGVDLKNAKRCIESGATWLAIGSALFNSPNPNEIIKKIRTFSINSTGLS